MCIDGKCVGFRLASYSVNIYEITDSDCTQSPSQSSDMTTHKNTHISSFFFAFLRSVWFCFRFALAFRLDRDDSAAISMFEFFFLVCVWSFDAVAHPKPTKSFSHQIEFRRATANECRKETSKRKRERMRKSQRGRTKKFMTSKENTMRFIIITWGGRLCVSSVSIEAADSIAG